MLSPFLSDGLPFGDPLGDNGLLDRNREDESGGPAFPGWVTNLIRTFAVIVIIAMLYYLARLILGRRQSREAPVAEVRARSSGGASFTDVLRDIFPGFRRHDANAWMRLH